MRLVGVTKPELDEKLAKLIKFLNQPRYKYQHLWDVGNLPVIDNTGALYGRTAISGGSVRVLFRSQVNREIEIAS